MKDGVFLLVINTNQAFLCPSEICQLAWITITYSTLLHTFDVITIHEFQRDIGSLVCSFMAYEDNTEISLEYYRVLGGKATTHTACDSLMRCRQLNKIQLYHYPARSSEQLSDTTLDYQFIFIVISLLALYFTC